MLVKQIGVNVNSTFLSLMRLLVSINRVFSHLSWKHSDLDKLFRTLKHISTASPTILEGMLFILAICLASSRWALLFLCKERHWFFLCLGDDSFITNLSFCGQPLVKIVQSDEKLRSRWQDPGIRILVSLEKGKTINSECYMALLDRLIAEMKKKWFRMKKKKRIFSIG